MITVKIALGANLPQGQLSLLVLYGDGTSDTQNVSSSQSNLQTGLNFFHRFTSLGSHQITLKITSPIDSKIYNSTIIVYDPISTVQVSINDVLCEVLYMYILYYILHIYFEELVT